jgi:hypothetical protein
MLLDLLGRSIEVAFTVVVMEGDILDDLAR